MKVRIDLTHFAERYESVVYQLSALTPHQREARNQLVGSDRIVAAAGTGKTYIALDVVLEDHLVANAQSTGADGGAVPWCTVTVTHHSKQVRRAISATPLGDSSWRLLSATSLGDFSRLRISAAHLGAISM